MRSIYACAVQLFSAVLSPVHTSDNVAGFGDIVAIVPSTQATLSLKPATIRQHCCQKHNVAGFGDIVAGFGDNVAGVDGALRCNIFGRRRMLLARPTFVTLLANGKVGRIAGSVAVTNKCILTL